MTAIDSKKATARETAAVREISLTLPRELRTPSSQLPDSRSGWQMILMSGFGGPPQASSCGGLLKIKVAVIY
jgi:hypothetical protein